MKMHLAGLAAGAGLAAAFSASAAPDASESLARLEAKWVGVMTRIRGWNEDALRQFREGYRDYPPAVLEAALAARTFEKMQETLDAHAALQAQQAMGKAMKVHAIGQTLPEDADNPLVAEAKSLVAKSLGDDARDLVFIPITPCTVWDTRFATNPDSAGIINNATTKRFYSHLDGAGGSYAAYGGNPSCPETAQNAIGLRPFAVMMTVYINDATAQGWLTLYRDGDPDPSLATISVYYAAGPTRTQTVISKSSRGYGSGAYDIAATSRFANTHASASITGYFVKVTDAGTVTSIATGTGLTGGPITTSGTISADLAVLQARVGGSCPAGSSIRVVAADGTVTCQADTNSGGTVTAVGAASPLASSGGNTPSISFAPTTAGTVLAGTGAAPAFTASPSISGNLILANSTATAGNVMKGGTTFLHNTGSPGTYVGVSAGNLTTTGSANVGVGSGALEAITNGGFNSATGAGALASNTVGNFNTANGTNAMALNIYGSSNTAVGTSALYFGNGSQNVAVGVSAMQASTSGSNNTAAGWFSLGSNTTGSGNTAIGDGAMSSNTTGFNNIALGTNAGFNLTTGAGNIAIGNLAQAAESGTIRIGNTQTRAFVAGIRGTTTGIADAIPVLVASDGQLGTVSSSAAVKENVADMGAASSALMQLRPVTFDYRERQAGSRLQFGLIAEEVDKVYPGLVARRPDGSAETVMYQFLPPMLLNEYQKQQRRIESQSEEISALRRDLARLERLLQREGAQNTR